MRGLFKNEGDVRGRRTRCQRGNPRAEKSMMSKSINTKGLKAGKIG